MSADDLARLLHAQPVHCRRWGPDTCSSCKRNADALIAAGWTSPDDVLRRMFETLSQAAELLTASGTEWALSAAEDIRTWIASKSAEALCGDWPAPCNCDDTVKHGGHTP